MRVIQLVVLIIPAMVALAQQESELQVGDTLFFGNCNAETYTYIDRYKKSRIEEADTADYSQLEFWDFYNTFFELGDFDVSRMACDKKDDFCIIKHMMMLSAEQSEPVTVVIGLMSNGLSAAYITEDAFINEEVLLAPQQ